MSKIAFSQEKSCLELLSKQNWLDEAVEEVRALSDDSGSPRLLFLAPVEGETIVHLSFLVKDRLLHLHLPDTLLLRLKRLPDENQNLNLAETNQFYLNLTETNHR